MRESLEVEVGHGILRDALHLHPLGHGVPLVKEPVVQVQVLHVPHLHVVHVHVVHVHAVQVVNVVDVVVHHCEIKIKIFGKCKSK